MPSIRRQLRRLVLLACGATLLLAAGGLAVCDVFSRGEVFRTAAASAAIAAAAVMASVGVAMWLAQRWQQQVADPLLQLADVARQAAANKNFTLRAPVQATDELNQVSGALNELLDACQAHHGASRQTHESTQREAAELARLNATVETARRERDQAQAASRQAEERFHLAARATQTIARDWDAASGAMWWNAGLQQEFGFLPHEIEPGIASWLNRIHPDDRERVEAEWRRAQESSGNAWTQPYRFRRADGTYAPVEDRGHFVRDAQGRAQRFVAMMSDATDRRRAAEALTQAKEAAEAASAAKGQFLANMSHEIRTPLNAIIGMTALALDTQLSSEQRGLLSTVKESSDTLLSLINEILDFSKVEAGKVQLESADFHLRDTVEDAVFSLALAAHQKGLELACHIPPEVPNAVIGDAGRLRQVILNLLGNAIKFTERGEVVLAVTLDRRAEPEVVLRFAVRDTGIGIPRDKQQVIFEAFSQAEASTARTHGGTGLGLAISAQLVALMGGALRVESEPGQGSTFHFTARFNLQKEPGTTRLQRQKLNDLSVLIVDDNATNRRILEELVRKWGMRPMAVDSGAAGLAALEQQAAQGEPFALALLDAMMPGLDGFMLAEQIKQRPQLLQTVIMMLSSAGQLQDAQRCKSLGISLYLTKPVKQSVLLDSMLVALGSAPVGRQRLAGESDGASAQPRRKLRLLLVEDNPVNQRLALRVLEKWGHAVTVASNGRRGVAAWEQEPFDLILMDVQMPEMSGTEATAAIREREKTSGRRTPIIAMTAHAMSGDRDRCLAAGMDEYLTKPIDQKKLFEAIERLSAGANPALKSSVPTEAASKSGSCRGHETLTEGSQSLLTSTATSHNRSQSLVTSTATSDRVAAAAPTPSEPEFDTAFALSRVENDWELLTEVAKLFLEDTPKLQQELRAALAAGQANQLERAAHTLKGSLANFGAQPTLKLVKQLEELGRAGRLDGARELLDQLDARLAALAPALERFLKKEAA